MGSVVFLLYVSQVPQSNEDGDQEALRRKVLEYSMPSDVTGILIYRHGYFLQYLEGWESSVVDLFSQIRGCLNHFNVRVLSRGALSRRRFSDWSVQAVSDHGSTPSSESLIDLFETVLMSKSNSDGEIDAILKRFCRGAHLISPHC